MVTNYYTSFLKYDSEETEKVGQQIEINNQDDYAIWLQYFLMLCNIYAHTFVYIIWSVCIRNVLCVCGQIIPEIMEEYNQLLISLLTFKQSWIISKTLVNLQRYSIFM